MVRFYVIRALAERDGPTALYGTGRGRPAVPKSSSARWVATFVGSLAGLRTVCPLTSQSSVLVDERHYLAAKARS